MPYNFVPPLGRFPALLIYFWESGAIGDIDEEYGLLDVGDNVTPRDPKEEEGYEDVKIPKFFRRYYCVHEETSY